MSKIHGVPRSHPSRCFVRRQPAAASAPADTKSFEFDGATSYMTGSYDWTYFGMNDTSNPPHTGPWTVSVWVKVTTGTGYQGVLELKNAGGVSDMCRLVIGAKAAAPYSVIFQAFQSGVDQTGGVGIGAGGSAPWFGGAHWSAGGVDPYDGGWHHIAVTCEGVPGTGQVKLYYDSVVIGSATQKTTIIEPGGIAYLGTDHYGFRLGGRIAQVAMFKSEFNQADIASLYNGGSGTNPSALGPYTFLRMGDNAGDTATSAVDEGSGLRNFAGVNPGAITIVADSP